MLHYQWIKAPDGALDSSFIQSIVSNQGLNTFVETGTFEAETVLRMRQFFKSIYSIELSEHYFEQALAKTRDFPEIHLINADSAVGLHRVISQLPEDAACLYWLDAHYSGGATARGAENSPVKDELSHILERASDRDIILIDDLRYFRTIPSGFLEHEAIGGYPALDGLVAMIDAAPVDYEKMIFGDALMAAPKRNGSRMSTVLEACTRSRLRPDGQALTADIAAVLKGAKDKEREALINLPDYMIGQAEYGLGGHFFAWRSVVLAEMGRAAEAAADLRFARKSGVVL